MSIDIDSSLKRIAWAYGCSPKGSEEEQALHRLLVRKVMRDATSSADVVPTPRRMQFDFETERAFPYDQAELVVRAISAAASPSPPRPLYLCVADAFGLGSTLARDLCSRFGKDPDAMVGSCKVCDDTGWAPVGMPEPPHYIDKVLCDCPAGRAKGEKLRAERDRKR